MRLAVESELPDSVRGEPLARVVREAEGVRLEQREPHAPGRQAEIQVGGVGAQSFAERMKQSNR